VLQHARFFDHSSFTSLGYPPCHECVPKFKNSLVCSEINSTFSPNIKSSTSHHGIKVCMRKLPCCHCQQSIQTLGTHFLLTRYSVPLEWNFYYHYCQHSVGGQLFKYAWEWTYIPTERLLVNFVLCLCLSKLGVQSLVRILVALFDTLQPQTFVCFLWYVAELLTYYLVSCRTLLESRLLFTF